MGKLKVVLGGMVTAVLVSCVPVVNSIAGFTGCSDFGGNVALAGAVDQIRGGFEAVGGSQSDDLTSMAGTVIKTMLFIVGILAVVMIIWSGIRYITAHGDKGQLENAKNTLIYSIVGLVIAIIAYAIVNFVVGLF